jgi:Na+-translocating ferredoxin:NAD+ oxidoreductase RnfD subunit
MNDGGDDAPLTSRGRLVFGLCIGLVFAVGIGLIVLTRLG